VRIALFIPCFVEHLQPEVGLATLAVLRALGHEPFVPPHQTCCGQPAWNMGARAGAVTAARHLLRVMREGGALDADAIVCPSASCTAMVRCHFGELGLPAADAALLGELVPRLHEFSEFVARAHPNAASLAQSTAEPLRVAVHRSCHSLRVLGLTDEPERLLAGLPAIELAPLEHPEECCGFGGVFSAKLPEASTSMADDKLADAVRAGAQVLTSVDSSCLMALEARARRTGVALRFAHVASMMAHAMGLTALPSGGATHATPACSKPRPGTLRHRMAEAVADSGQRARLDRSVGHALRIRAERVAERPDWEDLRERAAAMRRYSLGRLGDLLEEFESAAEAQGARVHYASTASDARSLLLRLVGAPGPALVKSKSMVTEEIGFRAALEGAGIPFLETDLGEYIVQLSHTTPSHIVAPVIHLSAEDIAEVFRRELGMDLPAGADPKTISLAAREHLRPYFVNARLGMVGANFLAAREGAVVTCTNEGNAGLGSTIPKRLIAVSGIDKLNPSLPDLAAPLQLLGSSSTGQRLTCYTHVFRPGGARETDIVLLDGGRSELLADPELRDALACIRCGACMHVCPVYRRAGGQAYGWIYPGPIGIILSAFLESPEGTRMADACSLCGACVEICPVKIDLPAAIRLVRERAVARSALARLTGLAAARLFGSPRLWRWGGRGLRSLLGRGVALGPLRDWAATRELPPSPSASLSDCMKGDDGNA